VTAQDQSQPGGTPPLDASTRLQPDDRRSSIVRRATRRAQIAKHVGPHTLRHAFITAALDAGSLCVTSRKLPTMRYDRARISLDRHATYIVATHVAGSKVASQPRSHKAVWSPSTARRPPQARSRTAVRFGEALLAVLKLRYADRGDLRSAGLRSCPAVRARKSSITQQNW
jgi:hypothetical protein